MSSVAVKSLAPTTATSFAGSAHSLAALETPEITHWADAGSTVVPEKPITTSTSVLGQGGVDNDAAQSIFAQQAYNQDSFAATNAGSQAISAEGSSACGKDSHAGRALGSVVVIAGLACAAAKPAIDWMWPDGAPGELEKDD